MIYEETTKNWNNLKFFLSIWQNVVLKTSKRLVFVSFSSYLTIKRWKIITVGRYILLVLLALENFQRNRKENKITSLNSRTFIWMKSYEVHYIEYMLISKTKTTTKINKKTERKKEIYFSDYLEYYMPTVFYYKFHCWFVYFRYGVASAM